MSEDATAPSPVAAPEEDFEPRRLLRRATVLAVIACLGVAAILWLPALDPVRDRFANTDGRWVAVAFALQAASVLSFVAAFRGAFERRIGWRASFDLAVVEEGANVILPSGGSGGLAIGAVLLSRAGVPTRVAAGRSAVLFLVTSAVTFAALILAGAGVAVGVLPGDASLIATLGPAAGAAAVLLAAAVVPRRLPVLAARADQRVRSRLRGLQLFLRDAVDMSLSEIRGGNVLLLAGSVGYFAFDVASLAAAFHALDNGGLPVGTFVLAYVIGHGGALIPLPGSAEGGLVGMYTAYGASLSLSVGAILVYRTFHAGLPVVLGMLGYADIRRLRHDRAPEEVARRFTST